MLRDLDVLLDELQQGLMSVLDEKVIHLRIKNAEILLPVDLRIIFRDGGVIIQGDVQRNYDDAHWFDDFSRLRIVWQEMATEEVLL